MATTVIHTRRRLSHPPTPPDRHPRGSASRSFPPRTALAVRVSGPKLVWVRVPSRAPFWVSASAAPSRTKTTTTVTLSSPPASSGTGHEAVGRRSR